VKTPPSSFADFQALAADADLSKYERIGFPDSYREGFEEAIYADIERKLSKLVLPGQRVIDIGPGCSDLPRMLINACKARKHHLTLIDGAEMLAQLRPDPEVGQLAALFPDCQEFIEANRESIDVILSYSVLQYVTRDTSLLAFWDAALSLLAPGGQMLIGDIPNISKRKRFFASDTGKQFHRHFMRTDADPPVTFNVIDPGEIDDSVVMMLTQRARAAGFDAYVLPQDTSLPMANRREDILVVRP
jgi:cyclopropane fatty-acyl-phospholipid synthase-like methyltransferase